MDDSTFSAFWPGKQKECRPGHIKGRERGCIDMSNHSEVAISNQSTFSGTLLDVGIILASIVALFLIAVWSLRRQAAVVSTI